MHAEAESPSQSCAEAAPSDYIANLRAMEECLEALSMAADGSASEEDACFNGEVYAVLDSVTTGAEDRLFHNHILEVQGVTGEQKLQPLSWLPSTFYQAVEGMAVGDKRAAVPARADINGESSEKEATKIETGYSPSSSGALRRALSPLSVPFKPKPASVGCQSPFFSPTTQPFEPTSASAGRQSPLSIKAKPFQPKTSPPNAMSFPNTKTSNRTNKAVVVDISVPICATKEPTPKILPGLEYIIGVDDAKKAARSRQKKQIKDSTKINEVKVAREKDEQVVAGKKTSIGQKRTDAKPTSSEEAASVAGKSSPPAPSEKSVKAPDVDEMPELEDIMSVLNNRSISKENRQRKLDEIFGTE